MIDGDVIAETDRVVLRPWRVDEADRLFDTRRRMEVARWIGGRPMVDRMEAVGWIERISALLADDPRFGAWAVTHLDNRRSAAVCTKLGMRELGVTYRWYHEPSRMFWAGAEPGQRPTLAPDRPVPD